jgi:heme exporter protein C
MNIYKYASPVAFYPLAGKLVPYFAVIAVILAALGLYLGLFVAPQDYQQGEVYRIIFIHVPTSWMAMVIYIVMALYGILALSFNTRLSSMMMEALAPTGAMFTVLALFTGGMWGKPTWGTYWVWDAHHIDPDFAFFIRRLPCAHACD